MTFGEVASRIGTGAAPRIRATVCSLVIGLPRLTGWTNVAAELRHRARHDQTTSNLVVTT